MTIKLFKYKHLHVVGNIRFEICYLWFYQGEEKLMNVLVKYR